MSVKETRSVFASNQELARTSVDSTVDLVQMSSRSSDTMTTQLELGLQQATILTDKSDSESAFAMLIGGRDEKNNKFTRACMKDVAAMKELLIMSKMVPQKNIYIITQDAIRTEGEIDYLYLHIKRNKPKKLFLYFSGHSVPMALNQRRLYVGYEQGNALNTGKVETFIEGLLPGCTQLIIILDCCSAGENILLPTLPATFMPERIHAQLSSSRAGGTSYASGEEIRK